MQLYFTHNSHENILIETFEINFTRLDDIITFFIYLTEIKFVEFIYVIKIRTKLTENTCQVIQ